MSILCSSYIVCVFDDNIIFEIMSPPQIKRYGLSSFIKDPDRIDWMDIIHDRISLNLETYVH